MSDPDFVLLPYLPEGGEEPFFVRVPKVIPEGHPYWSASYDEAERTLTVSCRMPGDVDRNSIMLTVSREMALDFGLLEPTPEEAARRAAEHADYIAARDRQRALPDAELTLSALLEYLGWSPAYARHVLHPACSCSPTGDDPWLCDFAEHLGFTEVGGNRG